MITTEAEALKNWCPDSRIIVYTVIENVVGISHTVQSVKKNYNRPAPHCFCLGSKCQRWEWIDAAFTEGYCGKGNRE